MVFSASQIRFVPLLLVLFGVAFILLELQPRTSAPTQQVWGDRHDRDNFDATRNATLGVIIPPQASPEDISTHNYLGAKSLRY